MEECLDLNYSTFRDQTDKNDIRPQVALMKLANIVSGLPKALDPVVIGKIKPDRKSNKTFN